MASSGKFSMTVTGVENVLSKLSHIETATPSNAAAALQAEGELIMTNAKERTPVDKGVLKASGRTQLFQVGRDITVRLSFNTDYAVFVHEIPPPPNTSPGGRSATHKVGEWKFLEKSINAVADVLLARIAGRLRGVIVGGGAATGKGGMGSGSEFL